MTSNQKKCDCGKVAFTQLNDPLKLICRICFSNYIQDKVRRTVNRYRMLAEGDHIAIGLSGGKDSTVLLDVMIKLQKVHPLSQITVISIDEGISGYRENALRIAQLNAEKNNKKIVVTSFEEQFGYSLDDLVQKAHTQNFGQKPCSICGKLRRRALNNSSRAIGATKLATGHNLDDEAQTCLLNFLRGDSIRFKRMTRTPVQKHPQLIPRIKPLVEITEREIQLYAIAQNIDYHDEDCPYAMTAMRNDVRSFLISQEEKRSNTLKSILRFHDRLFSTKSETEDMKLDLCQICKEPTNAEICNVCITLDSLNIKNKS